MMNCFRNITKRDYLILPLLFLLLAGCSPKTTKSTLPFDTPDSFSESGNFDVQSAWWKEFNDPQLDQFMYQALDSNLNLLAAWERVVVANAVVKQAKSGLFPQVDANAQSGLSRPEPDFVGGENVRLSLSASYEVDLWGRIRSAMHAEQFRAEATLHDYEATAISLAAQITNTWYQLQTNLNLLKLTDEQITNNENIMRLIRARFGIGQIRGVDILRQRQLLEATIQRKYQLESQVAVLEHQLAVLLGQPPQLDLIYAPDSLPQLPPLPNTGLPVELITRRPDVKSAFSLLNAADRDVASAISNQYPRINISTSYALRSNNFQDLFSQWAYSLAGGILAPLFYGGRLSAEVDRSKAFKQQLLYEYGQSVLVAFQEVENAIIQEQKQQDVIISLEDQVDMASRAYEQLRIEYFNGLSDYLAVLAELTQLQQLQRDLLNARFLLIQYRIDLYRSLAGGIEPEEEEEQS